MLIDLVSVFSLLSPSMGLVDIELGLGGYVLGGYIATFWERAAHSVDCVLTQLTMCSLRIASIFYFGYFPSWFRGETRLLIAPVPGNCVPF